MRRHLTLRRETLSPLAAADLAAVVGADALPTTPVGACVTDVTEDVAAVTSRVVECDSLFRPCVTSTCGGT